MRILIGITMFLPGTAYGGPATVAMNQARELARRGHSVTIATSDFLDLRAGTRVDIRRSSVDGVDIQYFKSVAPIRRFPAIISFPLAAWLRETVPDFDCVHVHMARDWIPITVARAASRAGVPFVLQPHGMLGTRSATRSLIDSLITKRLLRKAYRVLPLQEVERRSLVSLEPDARLDVIPNGISVGSPHGSWVEARLDRRVVLFVARLHPRKRLLDLLEAALILRDRGEPIRVRVIGPDEGALKAATDFVAQNGLDGIEFCGPLPPANVMEEFAAASIYVLPSVDEPFPMTVLEALSVGVPTVVTERIHIADLLRDQQAAVVVPPGGPSIAEAVSRLLAGGGTGQMSANGLRLVKDSLSIERVVDKLEELYQGAFAAGARKHK